MTHYARNKPMPDKMKFETLGMQYQQLKKLSGGLTQPIGGCDAPLAPDRGEVRDGLSLAGLTPPPMRGLAAPATPPLILASTSPQRHAILSKLGIPFTGIAPDVDESTDGIAPEDAPLFLARKKARSALDAARLLGARRFILGADTVVLLDGKIYGKPNDKAEAASFLQSFSGRTHRVITALSLLSADDERRYERSAETRVTVRELTAADIDWYTGTDEWRGAAGGYRAQGLGSRFLSNIDGLLSTVIGLPEEPLIELLNEAGIVFEIPSSSK
jgi:septum formation protein